MLDSQTGSPTALQRNLTTVASFFVRPGALVMLHPVSCQFRKSKAVPPRTTLCNLVLRSDTTSKEAQQHNGSALAIPIGSCAIAGHKIASATPGGTI